MRWRTWLVCGFLLLSPFWLEEVRLAWVLGTSDWSWYGPEDSKVQDGVGADGVRWRITYSSGSGGYNSDLDLYDRDGRKFSWTTNSDRNYPKILAGRSGHRNRFLVYQYYWLGSNFRIHEDPSLIHTGIWLVEYDQTGFRASPVVTNPASLLVREPLFVVFVVFNLLGW